MHSFEVHSNESVCRKSGCLGLEQVMYSMIVLYMLHLHINRRLITSYTFMV